MKTGSFLLVAALIVAVSAGMVLTAAGEKSSTETAIQGSVLYVCNCGAGCSCNTISDKPGKCKCGNDLRKVE